MSELFVARCRQPELLTGLSDSVSREVRELAPWLRTIEVRCGDTLIIAAVNARTPLGIARSSAGAAVALGYGREESSQDTAAQFLEEHARTGYAAGMRLCKEIGYGAAVSVLETGGLLLTTDYLGLFPMFIHASSAVTVCSSAVRLVRFVPGFTAQWDSETAIGGLLLSHNLFGRTVWRNVSRLEARQVLSLQMDGQTVLERCAQPNPSPDPGTFEDHLEACHATIQDIVKPYLSRGTQGTLMSGGLDSRLIAGYIAGGAGESSLGQGFLVGDETDTDVRCGRRVLDAIGFEQARIGVDSARYLEWALRETCWNAAERGLYGSHFWCLVEGLASSRTPVFTGSLGDAVMGASHVSWAYDQVYDDYSFDRMLQSVTAWGLPVRVIERLIRNPEAREIAGALQRLLGDTFESYPGDTWRRAWWFDLHHRQRFIVGRMAKLITATSWPVMPLADYRLISLVASFPLSSLRSRRLQLETAVRKFPKLAALPLDRNGNDVRSVRAGMRPRGPLSSFVNQTGNTIIGGLRRRLHLPDRRFHARMFDLNDPGWRKLRDLVRQDLAGVTDLIEPAEALRLIPPGEQTIRVFNNTWRETAGRKYLMGLILCYARWPGEATSSD